MGQTLSNAIVKFETDDADDEENALLFYSKPLINASLNIELSLESDDADKEAYFIRCTKPSSY